LPGEAGRRREQPGKHRDDERSRGGDRSTRPRLATDSDQYRLVPPRFGTDEHHDHANDREGERHGDARNEPASS
jgi:hypothetical protein